jgi:ubiquinone/menaquinone biosynthesis C-methylase UbiE
MANLVKAWRPESQQLATADLTVPYSGPPEQMTREMYREALQQRIAELIRENRKRAYEILSASPEHNPNLYEIALYHPEKDWPAQIATCDQMQVCLNQIDWKKTGQSLVIPENELPDLEAIAAALPS